MIESCGRHADLTARYSGEQFALALLDADRAGEEPIDKADWAMNLAKRQGRDRVVAFADQPVETA